MFHRARNWICWWLCERWRGRGEERRRARREFLCICCCCFFSSFIWSMHSNSDRDEDTARRWKKWKTKSKISSKVSIPGQTIYWKEVLAALSPTRLGWFGVEDGAHSFLRVLIPNVHFKQIAFIFMFVPSLCVLFMRCDACDWMHRNAIRCGRKGKSSEALCTQGARSYYILCWWHQANKWRAGGRLEADAGRNDTCASQTVWFELRRVHHIWSIRRWRLWLRCAVES